MTTIARIIKEALRPCPWRLSSRLEWQAYQADIAGRTELADMLREESERVVGEALNAQV